MVLKNIEDAIKAHWPDAAVRSFGSFSSNFSTFLSDVDITISGLAGYPPHIPPAPTAAPTMTSKQDSDVPTVTRLERVGELNKRQKISHSPVDDHDQLIIDLVTPPSSPAYVHIDATHPSSSSAVTFLQTESHCSSSSAHRSPGPSGNRNRPEVIQSLRALSRSLSSMDYTKALEFRFKARVPIIKLIHRGGIECDISIGQTDNLIPLLSYASSPSPSHLTKIFFEISCFLKIFFHQFQLDMPFTGGLGSYKIYGMIVFIINKISATHQQQSTFTTTSRGGTEELHTPTLAMS
jgi:hypothetical protein